MQVCKPPRKRLPLIRPVCPVHGVAMVVYFSGRGMRRHRCIVAGCEETKKSERR